MAALSETVETAVDMVAADAALLPRAAVSSQGRTEVVGRAGRKTRQLLWRCDMAGLSPHDQVLCTMKNNGLV